jgi:hypothetical protein
MIYTLVNKTTGKTVGYTTIGAFDTDCDISDEELLDARLEAAIDDGYIPNDVYRWKKATKKSGVLI